MARSNDGPGSYDFNTMNPSFEDPPSSNDSWNPLYSGGISELPVNHVDVSYDELRRLDRRRTTFPDSFVRAPVGDAMAMSGLFLRIYPDITQCYSCRKVQNNWYDGKNVLDPALHEKNCPHFTEASKSLSGVVQFQSGQENTTLAVPYNPDIPTNVRGGDLLETEIAGPSCFSSFEPYFKQTWECVSKGFDFVHGLFGSTAAKEHGGTVVEIHTPESTTCSTKQSTAQEGYQGSDLQDDFVLSDEEEIYGPSDEMVDNN